MQFLKLAFARLFMVTAVTFALGSYPVQADDSPREHLSLDANWKFHLGDDWPGALHLDKAGASTGPAAEKFSDSSWRVLNLPHDWAIELPFDKNADTSHGFKPVGPGYTKNSIGWYRRDFALPVEDSGKRIWLTFDGVFRDTTVWVNGWLITRHEGGYYPFREDITDVVHFGGDNVISVRVDATKFEGWFYEGAGIYRHVWLDKTGPVAIAPDGIFVHSYFPSNTPTGSAEISVQVDLLNASTNLLPQTKAVIYNDIVYPKSEVVGEMSYQIVNPNGETNEVTNEFPGMNTLHLLVNGRQGTIASFKISSPVLWSPNHQASTNSSQPFRFTEKWLTKKKLNSASAQ